MASNLHKIKYGKLKALPLCLLIFSWLYLSSEKEEKKRKNSSWKSTISFPTAFDNLNPIVSPPH